MLLSPAAEGNMFSFSFETEAGNNYTVEFTGSFNPANWQTLTNVSGNDSAAQIVDHLGSEQRYYRVRMQ